jgi:hypothetical protein
MYNIIRILPLYKENQANSNISKQDQQANTQFIVNLSGPSQPRTFENPRPKPKTNLYKGLFPNKREKSIQKNRKNEISTYTKLDIQEDKVSILSYFNNLINILILS